MQQRNVAVPAMLIAGLLALAAPPALAAKHGTSHHKTAQHKSHSSGHKHAAKSNGKKGDKGGGRSAGNPGSTNPADQALGVLNSLTSH